MSRYKDLVHLGARIVRSDRVDRDDAIDVLNIALKLSAEARDLVIRVEDLQQECGKLKSEIRFLMREIDKAMEAGDDG